MKELKDYLKIINRYKLLILTLMVVSGGLVFGWVLTIPKQYQASVTLYVNKVAEPSNDKYYTFEGYYSELAALSYTDVVTSMIKTSDIVRLAINNGGLTISDSDLLNAVQVKKVGPQLISVMVTGKDQNLAKKELLAVAAAEAERTKTLNQSDSRGMTVSLVNTEPLITVVKPNLLLYVGASLVGSLILGLLFILTREYFLP